MPSDGGIKAVDGDNIFPEGGIMTLEGAGGIVNSESDRSQQRGAVSFVSRNKPPTD